MQADKRSRLWLASLVILPYISYLGLLIMVGLWLTALAKRGRQVWQLCMRRGFGWLSLGLIISGCFAWDRGEAFLQLANFLPFFLFFGVLATVPALTNNPVKQLATVARWLLLTAMPIGAIAIVEYALKFERIMPTIKAAPLPSWFLGWLYEEPSFGHRAHSVFSHPNGLSAYLAIVLGLGLGLVVKGLSDATLNATAANSKVSSDSTSQHKIAQAIAVVITLAATFCTGSRNGVLIALVMLAIALYAARRHRWVMFLGLLGSGAIAAAAITFGIGGRSLSLELLTQDPRIGVWQLAWEMIQQRPWLGWGFAGMRLRYVPNSVPGYDIIYHAHNIWLYLASEAGIPLMVGFCAVIGTLYYRGIRAFCDRRLPADHRAILLSYLLAFTSCLMFNLFDVTLFDSRLNILSYGLLAGIYVLSRDRYPKAESNTR